MTQNQDPKRTLAPRSGSFFQELANRFRLISRLLMDSRVSPLVKVLPVAALAYVVWPLDLLPGPIPVDDAFILWLGTTLFVELCPPDVVQEHLQSLDRWSVFSKGQNPPGSPSSQEGDVVEGEFFDIDARK